MVEAVLTAAEADPGAVAVDLGCGTGQVSIPLARSGMQVTAVDVSPEMINRLRAKTERDGLDGVVGVASPIESLELEPETASSPSWRCWLHRRDGPQRTRMSTLGSVRPCR